MCIRDRSYTRFQTESMGLAVQGTEVTVIEKVTNVGGMSGRETIQVYVEAPQGKLGKPLRQLAAYAKTDVYKRQTGKNSHQGFTVPQHVGLLRRG